jgi:hypothetical protein
MRQEILRQLAVACLASVALFAVTDHAGFRPAAQAAEEVRKVEPEFGGSCAMGLAEGKQMRTDCSISWTASDGKLYCFGTEDSKAAFLKDPEANIQRARDHFAAGGVAPTGDDMGKFVSDDAKVFVENEIKAASEKTGLFEINDARAGQTLALKFVGVDFVRTLHGYGFFPNVNFAAPDNPAKKYQIDFWVKPKDGKLSIVDVRVYKAPRKEGDDWVMITRQPKPWWWIPASEHPGESETKRGWEVMSALHEHIAAERAKNSGKYLLKDDKTGEMIATDFVGIHQPVRRLKENGQFFACTDFRKDGSTDEYYDVDFWLDEKSGKITVNSVRLHKVPTLEDGNFVQIPRYSFDPATFEVVP